MVTQEILEIATEQVKTAGFRGYGTSGTLFMRKARTESGYDLKVFASVRQRVVEVQYSSWIAKSPKGVDVEVEAVIEHPLATDSVKIASMKVEVDEGEEIDSSFFPDLLHKVLEKTARVLGELASLAAVGALVGDF